MSSSLGADGPKASRPPGGPWRDPFGPDGRRIAWAKQVMDTLRCFECFL